MVSEGVRGGFALAYKVLSGFEESGRARRGYFVDGLGAAQFATGATVDGCATSCWNRIAAPKLEAITLAATDPANPYGAALPWPGAPAAVVTEPGVAQEPPEKRGHRPGRKAGALVVMVDGSLVLYVERGGKTVLTFTADDDVLRAAAVSLTAIVRSRIGKLRIERIDGEFSVGTNLGTMLDAAGFAATPQGMRLRA